MLIDLIMTKLI